MDYSTIVIFCQTLPYWTSVTDAQQIEQELLFLSQKFERVIIVPTSGGDTKDLNWSKNKVELDDFWIDSKEHRFKWRRIGHLIDSELWRLTSGDRSIKSLKYVSEMMSLSAALRRWIECRRIDLETTLFYAFRFDLAAGALALLSKSRPINFFVRAHYEDLCFSIVPRPIADLVVSSAKMIFPSDEAGVESLKSKFPRYADKFDVELLGSSKEFKDRLASHNSVSARNLTFLSVAGFTRENRVELNYKLLKALAVARPQTEIRWIHIGDGPLMDSLRELVEKDCPANLSIVWPGSQDIAFVESLYQSDKIDWAMRLSEGEGLPHSVCESLSYGVPVVGTMVRGIQEAIDDDCGLLLAPDPEPEEFVRGILPYIESDYRMDSLRVSAFKRWADHFDADKLRPLFVERISRL